MFLQRTQFNSQHPRGGSRSPVTLVPEPHTLFWPQACTQYTYAQAGKTVIHFNLNKCFCFELKEKDFFFKALTLGSFSFFSVVFYSAKSSPPKQRQKSFAHIKLSSMVAQHQTQCGCPVSPDKHKERSSKHRKTAIPFPFPLPPPLPPPASLIPEGGPSLSQRLF